MRKATEYHLQIVYEDNHLLIVNKPAGILVQGDNTGDVPLLDYCKKYIKDKYQKPGDVFLGLVHRLDRPVSGVVVFARTSKALERMNKLFQSRDVEKVYWAVVKNKPLNERGQLKHWLIKDTQKNITKAYNSEKRGGKLSELEYNLVGRIGDLYLLEIKLLTGRSHQIRAQLAKIGCPIKGDVKYGFNKPNQENNINLHAINLRFVHPVKKEPLEINAPIPNGFGWEAFKALEN